MSRLAFLAFVVLTIHFACGDHGGQVQDKSKKLKKCPLDYKKKYSSKKFQCIDLKPPSDVEQALQTCWDEAIQSVEFKCVKRENYHSMMRKGSRKGYKRRHHRHHRHHSSSNKTEEEKKVSGSSRRGSSRRGSSRRSGYSHRRRSWGKSRRGSYRRRRMFKMIIFKHLIKQNLPWWIFFTKEVAPPVFPMLVPEVQRKVQDRFRSCFLKKTKIGFEDKVNTQHLIEKLKLYKGHESNTTVLVNLINKCSTNATYQSEFSHCMTRNIAVTCIRKYINDNKHKWAKYRKYFNKTEETESNESEKEESEDDKKAEDDENDQIQKEIVTNEVSSGDNSKEDPDAKKSYGKGNKNSNKRKGKSADDDDDDDDDDEDDDKDKSKEVKNRRPSREERIKAWKERMKQRKGGKYHGKRHGGKYHWSHRKSCTPCFDLKVSEKVKSVMQECWETAGKGTYYNKIKTCMSSGKKDQERSKKMAKYISKYLDMAWIKLFKPVSSKKSFYITEEAMNNKQNCMFEKLGLGTTDNINKKGYAEMIKTHLIGDDNVKEILTKTVNKCGGAKPEGKVAYAKFAECTLPMLETACGLQ